jgi:hypothetical protein
MADEVETDGIITDEQEGEAPAVQNEDLGDPEPQDSQTALDADLNTLITQEFQELRNELAEHAKEDDARFQKLEMAVDLLTKAGPVPAISEESADDSDDAEEDAKTLEELDYSPKE